MMPYKGGKEELRNFISVNPFNERKGKGGGTHI